MRHDVIVITCGKFMRKITCEVYLSASSRNSHGQFSTLFAKIFHVVSLNPNLFNTTDVSRRVWRHFSPKKLGTRDANEMSFARSTQNRLQSRFTSKTCSLLRVETSLAANNSSHDICVSYPPCSHGIHGSSEHRHFGCAEFVLTALQQPSPEMSSSCSQ